MLLEPAIEGLWGGVFDRFFAGMLDRHEESALRGREGWVEVVLRGLEG